VHQRQREEYISKGMRSETAVSSLVLLYIVLPKLEENVGIEKRRL